MSVCNGLKDNGNCSKVHGKDFRKQYHKLIWSALEEKITLQEAIATIGNTLDNNPDKLSLFTDAIAATDTEVACFDDNNIRVQFQEFINAVSNVIPESILKERLDTETLESVGFLQSQKLFNQKLVRTKTKLFYKQQKYNLLREENEGYAKLITELNQDTFFSTSTNKILQNVLSLLGFFNLDPNRVLDILLEAFECRVEEDLTYVPLVVSYLSHCDVSGLAQLMGFKYQFYHQTIEASTPPSLYKLTAILLRSDLLDIRKLLPHLKPSDKELNSLNQKKLDEAKDEAKKLNSVILSDATEEGEKNSEKDEEIKKDNQKFGLVQALIELGAWTQVYPLICQLPELLLMSDGKISRALCHLIHCTVEPLYRSKFSPKAAVGNPYRTKRGYPQPCLQYEQLSDAVFPMLKKLGPYLSIDPVLLVKIIRVAKGFMKEYNQSAAADKEKMESVFASVLTLIEDVLFPSLSVLDCNCGVAEEMWGLLKRLNYETRYRLYAFWKNHSYSVHPSLIVAKAKTIKKAKYITKRLSKENVKPSGRKIGKLSHCNPGILFDHLLDQIQRYDNFIGPMVDALKYLNPLAYDVLAFCIIEALANPAKQRMKQSDTNLSAWLQSLSQFCGAVFKKYPTDITGLLQYIANQLKSGKSLDLLVLKEVVQKMSGVESNDDVTTQQLEALAGGELLKSEGAYFGQIRNTRKPSMRLRDALMEGKLTIPLCLLIAQQRNAIVYVEEQERHLKLIGKLYDQCQDNLIQFGAFLTIQLSTHDYQASLPSLDEFHDTYSITPDVSFFLTRPVYRFDIQEKLKALHTSFADKKDASSKQKAQEIEKLFCETCDNIFRPVVEAAIPLQASRIWNNLSPLLYVTFWSLSMYDLYTPNERYKDEVEKLKVAMNAVDDNKEIPSSSKKKKEKERCQFLIEKLNEEKQTQVEHNKLIKVWLESRENAWFPSKYAKGETITQFLQLCIFPRCVFSAIDAMYCAKFIQTIHTLKAPNFSTLICFDRTFSDVSYIVASLTENEASRYGRFLCAMLQMVMRWHGDKKLYDKECGNYPGFLTILRATSDKASYLDYENFRHVCHKWQYKLTKALILGIESEDYTQIRNTLLVLIKIIPYYPQVHNLGQALERRIEKIIEDEKDNRHDLQALAVGYNGMLKSRKASMVPEDQFHKKEKEKDPAKAPKTAGPVKAPVKQEGVEIVEQKTKPVIAAKKEDSERIESAHVSSNHESRRSKQEQLVGRSDREKELIEGENDWKKSSSRSPKGHSSNSSEKSKSDELRHKDLEKKDRSRERSKDSEKERRTRLSSPVVGEDLKKRKVASDDYTLSKKDRSFEKKTERKRTSTEPEQKELKRRKEEIVISSPDYSTTKKLEGYKKEKIKKDKSYEEKPKKESRLSDSKREGKDLKEDKMKRKKRDS